MILAFVIVFIVAGTFFFLWQEEHEKLIKAEKQISELKRKLKKGQKLGQPTKTRKKPQLQPVKPLLDQKKLAELQMQTRASQDMLAEIFNHQEENI